MLCLGEVKATESWIVPIGSGCVLLQWQYTACVCVCVCVGVQMGATSSRR